MSLQIDWLETESDESTSSLGGFPVKTFLLPVLELACPVSAAACGPSYFELSLRCDRVGASLRMYLALELSELTRCLMTWQEQTTPLGRWWWVLSMPELRTDENGFGLLPTPSETPYGRNKGGQNRDGPERPSLETMAKNGMLPTPQAYSHKDSNPPGTTPLDRMVRWGDPDGRMTSAKNTQSATTRTIAKTLTTVGSPGIQSTLLPTPKASDGRPKGNGGNRKSPGLDQMAKAGRLPTPTARDWKSTQASEATHERNSRPLSEVVGWMLPTPTIRDFNGAPGKGCQERGGRHSSLPAAVSNGAGTGLLSPCFVEWMMGYPEQWTNVDATDENA